MQPSTITTQPQLINNDNYHDDNDRDGHPCVCICTSIPPIAAGLGSSIALDNAGCGVLISMLSGNAVSIATWCFCSIIAQCLVQSYINPRKNPDDQASCSKGDPVASAYTSEKPCFPTNTVPLQL